MKRYGIREALANVGGEVEAIEFLSNPGSGAENEERSSNALVDIFGIDRLSSV